MLALTVGTPEPANAAYPGGNGWITYEEGNDIWVVSADTAQAGASPERAPEAAPKKPAIGPQA